jgi:hypothetical protein
MCWNLQDNPENVCEGLDMWMTSEGQYVANKISSTYNRADWLAANHLYLGGDT